MFRYGQFQDACCWERKQADIFISICFSYSTCVLEGDRAEADENINIFG